MTRGVRRALYACGLLGVFATALVGGRLVDSSPETAAAVQRPHRQGQPIRPNSLTTIGQTSSPLAVPAATTTHVAPTPAGLTISEAGYTLHAQNTLLHDHGNPLLVFTVQGPDGRTVTQFSRLQGAYMHLVAVSRDLSGYRHLHPTKSSDGTWSVPLRLPSPGSYRAFIQFTPVELNKTIILGVDLAAGGLFAPKSPPAPARAVQLGDGDDDEDDVDVSVNGWLHAGQDNDISFTFSRRALPVTDLQPYQDAYANLVAVREGDLAVQIARPTTTKPGPDLGFRLGIPTRGTYRLFLDFKRRDTVTTAAFTMVAQ